MPDPDRTTPETPDDAFTRQIVSQADRKRRAQATGRTGVWFGLGMAGMVGWSVALPTLLGAVLGLWLDAHHPASHSWTLALLVAGLVLGCANAGHWVWQQGLAINDRPQDHE